MAKSPEEIFAARMNSCIGKALEDGVGVESVLGSMEVIKNVLIMQALSHPDDEKPNIQIAPAGLKVERNND